MKKILFILMLLSTHVFAHFIGFPELVVNADGSTNYEGIHCVMEEGGWSDFHIRITINKSAKQKVVQMTLEDPEEHKIIASCFIAGHGNDNKRVYCLDISQEALEHTELRIWPADSGHISLKLKNIPITKTANQGMEPTSANAQSVVPED